MSKTTLQLAKQNFKFSSAHFLIFDEKNAERLHGHNYRVEVELSVPEQSLFADRGFFIDFNVFKKYINSALDRWDERVLLPSLHADMSFLEKAGTLEVRFRDRFYAFPLNEVVRLPVNNTSVEQLSKLLAEDFLKEFKQYKVSSLSVFVEETPGQGAKTTVNAD
jgi:6-pyruvoyltetrahydropterin/6-carboxytetrahydropterin synthase